MGQLMAQPAFECNLDYFSVNCWDSLITLTQNKLQQSTQIALIVFLSNSHHIGTDEIVQWNI